MNRHKSLALLLCAALVASCDLFEEGAEQLKEITAPLPASRIKFNNFSPSSVGVDFFANNVKMTGVLTSNCAAPTTAADSLACSTTGKEATTGTTYGGNAGGGLYVGIEPGQYTLAAKMAAKDTVVSTVTQTIVAGKYYTMFMSGIYSTTTKTAESFVVEDPITGNVDYTKAYVRFVNAVSNGTSDLNLWATDQRDTTRVGGVLRYTDSTIVGGPVAYKAAGAFVALDEGTYNVVARYAGAAALISRTTLTFAGGRFYTITARGSTATTTTLGLDFLQNQR